MGDRKAGSKIEFELGHKPVFLRTIELFRNFHFQDVTSGGEVGQILLAVNPRKMDDFKFRWGDQLGFQGVTLISGGAERWETVKLALEHVSEAATHVAVHDAARPCTSGEMIERVFAAAEKYGAAVPGVAMGDTVKRVERESGEGRGDSEGEDRGGEASGVLDVLFGGGERAEVTQAARKISETVSRAGLWRVQTPQVFEKGLITAAYGQLNSGNAVGVTDDASVAERAGHDVYMVEGDPLNLKLTHPEDAELLEAVLRMREEKDAKSKAEQALFGDEDED